MDRDEISADEQGYTTPGRNVMQQGYTIKAEYPVSGPTVVRCQKMSRLCTLYTHASRRTEDTGSQTILNWTWSCGCCEKRQQPKLSKAAATTRRASDKVHREDLPGDLQSSLESSAYLCTTCSGADLVKKCVWPVWGLIAATVVRGSSPIASCF